MEATETLTPDQVAEIEGRLRQWDRGEISKQAFPASWANVDALCRSLRAAWATNEWQKSTIENLTAGVTGCAERLAATQQQQYEAGFEAGTAFAKSVIEDLQSENAALRTQNQTQAESVECELCDKPVGDSPMCLECYNLQAGAWEESQKQIAQFQENEKSLKAQLAQVVTLTKREARILTDYHYYEAEKAITRWGCKAAQRAHLERLAELRKTYEPTD